MKSEIYVKRVVNGVEHRLTLEELTTYLDNVVKDVARKPSVEGPLLEVGKTYKDISDREWTITLCYSKFYPFEFTGVWNSDSGKVYAAFNDLGKCRNTGNFNLVV